MTTNVIPIGVDYQHPPTMTKTELARYLGFSRKWVELRMGEGMPYLRRSNGYTFFFVAEVEYWLYEQGRGGRPRPNGSISPTRGPGPVPPAPIGPAAAAA